MTSPKKETSANTETLAKKRGRPRKNPEPGKVVDSALAADIANEINDILGEGPIKVVPLEDNSYEELYRKATEIYRIPVTKDFTKGDLIDAIRRKQNGRRLDVAQLGSEVDKNELQPGWAEIELFKDPRPSARNRPQYFAVNGYRCMVPFGVKCRVPIKIFEVLKNAVEVTRVQDESVNARNSDQARFKVVESQRFPYQVYAIKEGPDPRPVMENRKRVAMRPREAFLDIFGYWPTSDQLREAIKDGIISLK
jgi:hypothetical protein